MQQMPERLPESLLAEIGRLPSDIDRDMLDDKYRKRLADLRSEAATYQRKFDSLKEKANEVKTVSLHPEANDDIHRTDDR